MGRVIGLIVNTTSRNFSPIYLSQKGLISQRECQFVKHSRTWPLERETCTQKRWWSRSRSWWRWRKSQGLCSADNLWGQSSGAQVSPGNQKVEMFTICWSVYGKLPWQELPRELKVCGRCRCLRKQSSLNIRLPLTQSKQTFYQTSSSCSEWHTSGTHKAHRSSWWKHRRMFS